MIHQHSWATDPGWVTHYISQGAFSGEKRFNVRVFTGAGGSNSAGVIIHTNNRMGHLKTSQGHCTGMIPTAWWGSCSCSSTATFSGLALSPTVCKKQRTHTGNFQLLKEELHPEKIKFTWIWINTVTLIS